MNGLKKISDDRLMELVKIFRERSRCAAIQASELDAGSAKSAYEERERECNEVVEMMLELMGCRVAIEVLSKHNQS